MANEGYQEYFKFLDQLGEVLERLTEVAKEKTAAVRRDDLNAVNECMKREQAISLKLRSMDIKRDKMLEKLGLQGTTLSVLAQSCPEEVRSEARAVADRVRSRYDVYRAAADVARTTLECNLHQIEKALKNTPDAPPAASFADIRA